MCFRWGKCFWPAFRRELSVLHSLYSYLSSAQFFLFRKRGFPASSNLSNQYFGIFRNSADWRMHSAGWKERWAYWCLHPAFAFSWKRCYCWCCFLRSVSARREFLLWLFPVLGIEMIMFPWIITLALLNQISLSLKLLILYGIIALIRNILEPHLLSKKSKYQLSICLLLCICLWNWWVFGGLWLHLLFLLVFK